MPFGVSQDQNGMPHFADLSQWPADPVPHEASQQGRNYSYLTLEKSGITAHQKPWVRQGQRWVWVDTWQPHTFRKAQGFL